MLKIYSVERTNYAVLQTTTSHWRSLVIAENPTDAKRFSLLTGMEDNKRYPLIASEIGTANEFQVEGMIVGH